MPEGEAAQTAPSFTAPTVTVDAGAISPDELERARAAVVTLGQDQRVESAELECVAVHVAGDQSLLAAMEAGTLAPDQEHSLDAAIRRCAHEVTATIDFVMSYAEDHPEVAEEQLRCIADGYSAIAVEEMDAVLAAASDPEAPKSDAVLKVLEGCGVR